MEELLNALKEIGYSENEKVENKKIAVNKLTFTKLRDKLFILGKIIYEDKSNQIYIAEIRPSKMGNTAVVAFKLSGGILYLSGYSKEGLIEQHTVEKAFNKIENELLDTRKQRRSKKPFVIMAIALIIVVAFVASTVNIIGIINATDSYNSQVKKYNETVKSYNELSKKGVLANIENMPEKMEALDIQNSDFFSALGVMFSSNNKDKIEKDESTIKNMINDNKNAIAVAKKIIAPKQDFVYDRLKKVEAIKEIEAVTKDKNPDGLLGKQGGYYSCLYFSVDSLSKEEISGDSVIDKGVDAGGAVEIYDNKEKAEERCEYLSSFDGTVLTTGSYAVVGTMVIRTSYKLDDTAQYNLTDSIIKEITK